MQASRAVGREGQKSAVARQHVRELCAGRLAVGAPGLSPRRAWADQVLDFVRHVGGPLLQSGNSSLSPSTLA